MQKTKLRVKMKVWRADQATMVVEQKSNLIAQQILNWSVLKQAEVIFCYVSRKAEVKTHFLLKQLLELDKTVAVPKITGPGQMKPAVIRDFSELVPAEHEILAPKKIEFLDQKIDLNLMPAVAVDLKGHRLGMGGGFYDRFLARYKPKINATLVFADQVLDFVPTDKFDRLIDAIITEKVLYEITQPSLKQSTN